jgi:pyridinium-3,5-bisthiocarboxylic acid mononucleotide nickel chelatase
MSGGYDTDLVTRLETNLDDLSPELTGAVMEKLLAAGALDVWFTPIQMKKNRPAVQLSVLCDEAHTEPLADLIFTETSAFGLRVEKITRLKLERRFQTVATEFGEITLKLGLRAGRIIQIAPEFESCLAASTRTGQPLKTIFQAALAAFHPDETPSN